MTRPALLAILLAVLWPAAAPAQSAAEKSYQSALEAFANGDFEQAQKLFNAAAQRTNDEALLARIHLSRGECFGAMQEFDKTEAAFAKALEYDPEAKLDPARVLPTVVAILDGLRARLRGELHVTSDTPGTLLSLDGQPAGAAPFRGPVPIGRHQVEARPPEGEKPIAREVLVRPRRTELVTFQFAKPGEGEPDGAAATRHAGVSPLFDLRTTIDPLPRPVPGVAFELGAGVGGRRWLVSAHATAAAAMALTLRGALRMPQLAGNLGAYASLDGVVFFAQPTVPGVGASVGAAYELTPWAEGFAEVSGRLLAESELFHTGYVLFGLGVRLRKP